MTVPDPRPQKRIRDIALMRRIHLAMIGEPCAICGERPGSELDHIRSRAQGGDDTPENLRWVCSRCHRKRHGG